jgi:hypothetical protein
MKMKWLIIPTTGYTVLATDTKWPVLWIRERFGTDYFLKVHLHHFSKIKSHKEATKTVGITGFLTIFD